MNNNALAYWGSVTPTVTPDNCKVAVARNKDWISPVLNKDFQAWAEHNNMEKVAAENRKPFEGLTYSRYNLFTTEDKETFLLLPLSRFEYLERKTVKIAQDFSFTFDKVHL